MARVVEGAATNDKNECISNALSNGMSVEDAHKKCIPDEDHNPADLKNGDPGKEFNDEYLGTTGTKTGNRNKKSAAIDYNDCLDQVQGYGLDDDSAKRICDSITNVDDSDSSDDDNSDDSDNDKRANYSDGGTANWYKSASSSLDDCISNCDDGDTDCIEQCKEDDDGQDDDSQDNSDDNSDNSDDSSDNSDDSSEDYKSLFDSAVDKKIIANCVKAKQKADSSISDIDAQKQCEEAFSAFNSGSYESYEADLKMQNQFTSPNKLDNYLSTDAIDWNSDEAADYNEKSDTKKIDLSYYDDDINKCVDEQVKNGLSQENARTFCQNLANYNGDSDITPDDQDLPVKYENREYVTGSDTGSHVAQVTTTNDTSAIDVGNTPTTKKQKKKSMGADTYLQDKGYPNLTTTGEDVDPQMSVDQKNLSDFSGGPTFDHITSDRADGDGHSGGDSETSMENGPDGISFDHNSSLDDNDHVDDGSDDFMSDMDEFLSDVQQDLQSSCPGYNNAGDDLDDGSDNENEDDDSDGEIGLALEIDIEGDDDSDSDNGDDMTKQAYYSPEQTSLAENDPLEGGDNDAPQIGSPVVTGHGENNTESDPHSHDLGTDGPRYDHFGNRVIDEADNSTPDQYELDNSSIDDNDFIIRHMHPAQKEMGEQNTERVPSMEDNESMAGLGYNSTPGSIQMKNGPGSAFDTGITEPDEMTAQPESPSSAPEGAKRIAKDMNLKKGEGLAVSRQASIQWTKSGSQTYSAEQCTADFGGDKDAKDICDYIGKNYSGSYDKYIADMRIEPFVSNNKLFVKAFLMDPSLNMNKWGVSPSTLDANIRSYVGKPLVLQENFDHPVSADDNLQHQLEYQELFRVGTISDIVKKNGRYDAIAEITDPYAQKAFREGNLPLYVSPQLYKLDASEPDDAMTKWTGTHLAIVKDPAYGIKLATVNGQCTGEHDTCMTYLKKAAIIRDHGYGNCGYCNYKVLTSARNAATSMSDPADDGTTPSDDTAQKKQKKKKQQDDSDNSDDNEKSAMAIEEDKRFIANMQKFIDNMKDDLRLLGEQNH